MPALPLASGWLGLHSADRLLATLPFFHINAQAYSTMGALACGSLAIVRRFSASRFWEDARALGATQFNAVGAMMHILLRREARPADREHGIRRCYGALALPASIAAIVVTAQTTPATPNIDGGPHFAAAHQEFHRFVQFVQHFAKGVLERPGQSDHALGCDFHRRIVAP